MLLEEYTQRSRTVHHHHKVVTASKQGGSYIALVYSSNDIKKTLH
jgi:hypothetical protein